MTNFSKQEIGSDITRKISFISKNILSKEIRNFSCETKTISKHLKFSQLEENIKKIFYSKVLSI